METLERKISNYLRRWLGMPRSCSSAALNGGSNKLRLPFSSLDEEFRVSHTRQAVLCWDSRDSKVESAVIIVRTCRNWRAQDGVDVAESQLRNRALVGKVAAGRAGFEAVPQPHLDKAHVKDRRHLILQEVRTSVEEKSSSRMASMRQQGAWIKWLGALKPYKSFFVKAVYDILPGPVNLHVWDKTDSATFPLCARNGTLEHILSNCPTVLREGHYCWRHNQVLNTVVETNSKAITENKYVINRRNIAFVRAGELLQP